MVPSVWLMLVAADCSTAAQDCSAGEMCTATGIADGCPERGRCEPLPAAAEIELSLPVSKGERVFCAYGNLRPGRYRVGACRPDERFSVVLASTAFEAPHVVVASADGRAYFWAGCSTINATKAADFVTKQCNNGAGNYVRVQHTADLYTEYQHLSAVLVDWGQLVKRGQPIGIEGSTGPAAMKEIGWGAHRGNALDGGPSIPMSRIRLLGGTASSATLKCGDMTRSGSPDPETAYLSDTTPVAPPTPNRFAFSPFKPEDSSAIDLLARLRMNPQDGNTALAQLRALPDVGENRYWLGVALQELKKNAEAEQLLRLQQGRPSLAPIYQQWIDLRLAELATARGADKEARALLEKIRDANDRADFKQRWQLAWAGLLAKTK